MDNNKHVLESFNEFLQYRGMTLNEKEGSPLDLEGAKELVKLIMEYNAKLATDFYKDAKYLSGEYNRAAASSLTKGDYALAGVYCIVGKIMTQLLTKDSFEILKTLIPSITDKDYDDYSKNRKSKGEKLLADLSKMKEDDAKKLAPEAVKKIDKTLFANYIPLAIKTPFIWGGLLSKAEQDKSYETFLAEASKKGYDTKEGLAKVIKDEYKDQKGDDRSHMQSPGISAYLDKTEAKVVKEGTPAPKEFKTAVIEEADEHEVFKPNMWGENGDDDYMEGAFKKIQDNLGAIFQRILTGEVTSIKSITIQTSADRYRNTGIAEEKGLSWGQLSYLRSLSMAGAVIEMARKSGLPEPTIKTINSMMMLDFKGENGDGTSGPNSPDTKFGYYTSDGKKSKWVDGKDRNLIYVTEVDDNGTPSGEPKEIKKSPESDKKAYNKYRYNNIEIEYEALSGKPGDPAPPASEKLVDLSYPIKVRIPARYRKKTIRIPLPYIKLGIRAKAGGGKKGGVKCADLSKGGGGSIRTTFGIGIRQVKIASWESDLTK
jgi:hypothetical protein